MNTRNDNGARGGFTLMELLVVLGIMGLLAGLVVPTFQVTITAQRRDECKEQLERIAQAIERRAEVLAQNVDFAKLLWENAPTGETSLPGGYPLINGAYFPNGVYHSADPTELNYTLVNLDRLIDGKILFHPSTGIPEMTIGGPFLSSVVDSMGNSSGANAFGLDPWDRPWNLDLFYGGSTISILPLFQPQDFPQGCENELSFLWTSVCILSFGPNGITDSFSSGSGTNQVLGDDMAVFVHLYGVLAKETLRRIDVVNEAIRAFRRDRGNESLGHDFIDVLTNRPAPPGIECVYGKLLAEGYLPNPGGSNMYAMDAWGYNLVTDLRLNRLEGKVPTKITQPFAAGDPDYNNSVTSVYSGNLVAPAHYGGWQYH